MKKIIFFFFAIIIVVIGCRKDIETEDTILIRIGEDETTNLHGRVVDPSGRSIPEVSITVKDQSVFTNGDGYFYMPNMSVPSDGFTLAAKSPSNDNVLKRVVPQAETNTYEEIVLAPSFEYDSFSANEESIIGDGITTVTILPNTLVNQEGDLYQGEYLARLKYYNPRDKNIQRAMPGNLQGIDKNGERVTLGTYGMIDISVIDPDGEPLTLSSNTTALVKMNFVGENSNIGINNIPTWKLDESSGLWLEEGETTDLTFFEDTGFIYFDIDEFRIWNCDIKELNTALNGIIIDQFGVPIENRLIQVTFNSDNQNFVCSGGNTNSKGEYNTRVPVGQVLTISIYDQNCQNIISTQEIGPFSGDVNFQDITAEITEDSYTVTGFAFDCNANVTLDNATVFLYDFEDNIIMNTQTNEDGAFSIHNICFNTTTDASFRVGVLNLDTGNYIETNLFSFTEIDIDIGNVFQCEDQFEYLNITTVFENLSFDDPSASYDTDSLVITASANGFSFTLLASVSETGVNPVEYLEVQYSDDIVLTCTSQFNHTICSEAVTLTIIEINDNTNMISGRIEGVLYYGSLDEPDSTQTSDVFIDFRVEY